MSPFKLSRRRNLGFLGSDSSVLSPQQQQERRQLRYELDLNSFNWRIWCVAASGFLTDSYNLFATNVILTSLAFVYWPDSRFHWQGMMINVVTLFGSACGQLLFGVLADYYGRTRLYGIELVLIIVSTVGVATCRSGYSPMSFLALFTWWRFIMGIGVGAEYPLSAVITAEWSSTQSRATMLSAVFMMQPIGQALAQLVGLWVLVDWDNAHGIDAKQCGLNTLYDEECKRHVDSIWRVVIGCGAIPALLAIAFRFYLFDSGIYTFDVKNKPEPPTINTYRKYDGDFPEADPSGPLDDQRASNLVSVVSGSSALSMPIQFSKADMRRYFIDEGNWLYLLGTSASWFFLDISFFGLSLDNRATLADMWSTRDEAPINLNLECWNSSLPGGTSHVPSWAKTGLPMWQTDGKNPCVTIYDVLYEQAIQYLATVSIGSVAGSILFVFFVDRLPRRQWLTTSFAILTCIFAITGLVCYTVFETPRAPATIACLALSHFLFNFGANTLTFIIPAEIFPTCYRCTCHGISAASGKMGSILAILIVFAINDTYKSTARQGLILIIFGAVAALGALVSWAYLPDVQRRVSVDDKDHEGDGPPGDKQSRKRTVLQNKTLEELGEGRERARQAGEILTITGKMAEVKRRREWAKAETPMTRPSRRHRNVSNL